MLTTVYLRGFTVHTSYIRHIRYIRYIRYINHISAIQNIWQLILEFGAKNVSLCAKFALPGSHFGHPKDGCHVFLLYKLLADKA